MKTASITLKYPINASELDEETLVLWDMLIASNRQNLINTLERKGINMISASRGSFDIEFSAEINKRNIAFAFNYTLRGCFPFEQVMIAFGKSEDISLAPLGKLYEIQKPIKESIPDFPWMF